MGDKHDEQWQQQGADQARAVHLGLRLGSAAEAAVPSDSCGRLLPWIRVCVFGFAEWHGSQLSIPQAICPLRQAPQKRPSAISAIAILSPPAFI
jgi:hypothetical protein